MASDHIETVVLFGRTMPAAELAARLQDAKTRFDLPKFWPDAEVRQAAIDLYRKATLTKTVEEMRERFGEGRAPSRSGLNRFWMRLDTLNGRKR